MLWVKRLSCKVLWLVVFKSIQVLWPFNQDFDWNRICLASNVPLWESQGLCGFWFLLIVSFASVADSLLLSWYHFCTLVFWCNKAPIMPPLHSFDFLIKVQAVPSCIQKNKQDSSQPQRVFLGHCSLFPTLLNFWKILPSELNNSLWESTHPDPTDSPNADFLLLRLYV